MSIAQSTEPNQDELRIALAMRGGVSLAVWIGGASAEVEALCADATVDDHFWPKLADAAGYGNVIVDVMSGASAGGLNAVIGAAGMVYGFSVDELREVWQKLGDLNAMVRTDRADAHDGLSLLRGDGYFLAKLDEELQALATDKHVAGKSPRVDVTLAATLLRPISVERVSGDADTTEQRFTSTFRFRNGSPVHTDFPQNAAARAVALKRLALAGRATSSFPAAFEAALVSSTRPASFSAARTVPASAGGLTAMFGVFGDATASQRPFCVMDGGVLDNIPISRAIDAIVDAPADRPTRRVLVYVQPGSPGSTAETTDAVDRSTPAVLSALVKTRMQEETIAGDLRELDQHNARVRRSRISARASVHGLTKNPGTAGDVRQRYIAQRASQEATDVTQLLDDPIGVLRGDPFPKLPRRDDTDVSKLDDIDLRWRSPIALRWGREATADLQVQLTKQISTLLDGSSAPNDVLAAGAGPIRRLAQLLIDACRGLVALSPSESANKIKGRLYRVLTVHTELVEYPRALAWVALAAREAPGSQAGTAAWAKAAVERVESVTALPPECINDVIVPYLDGAEGDLQLADADLAMRQRLDTLLGNGQALVEGVDLRNFLLDRLAALAEDLVKVMRRSTVTSTTLSSRADQDLGAAVLTWLEASSNSSMPDHLALLEQATYDPSIIGELGSGAIDFVRLSGANPTPLAAAFPLLLGDLRQEDPWGTIAARLSAAPPKLGDDRKLAGNELANFSAFLRARWRANDWMWGRLDAVPTLVEVLVEPDRMRKLAVSLRNEHSDAGRAEMLECFRSIVCSPGRAVVSGDWTEFFLATAWEPREAAIRKAVDDIVKAAASEENVGVESLVELRAALISARQWAIIAELLPSVHEAVDVDDAPAASPAVEEPSPKAVEYPSPKDIVDEANEYWVGVETIGNPASKRDGELVVNLVGAVQQMLGRTTSGPGAIVGRVLGPTVALLRWIWLKKTWPKLAGFALILVALAGLTVPLLTIADGSWQDRVIAAAAGPSAVLFVFGTVVFLLRSPSVGLLICLVGIFGVFWASWRSGLPAMAVGIAIAAAFALVLGVALTLLVRLRPRLPS